jgi:hypothetical protein
MSTNRDVERIVRSWLDEGVTVLPDRVLDAVLDQLPATPQRRAGWLARRFPVMNSNIVRFGLAAVVVVLAVIVAVRFLPEGVGGPGPDATPSPSPTPIAVGSFLSHGGQVELDANGEGSNVTGSMTVSDIRAGAFDVGGADVASFAVDLACTRTTDSGLIVIGGLVTDSTNIDQYAPEGSNVAIILQRGSPVKAVFWFEHPDPHQASCPAFLESISDAGDFATSLQPIDGTLELRP